MLVFTVVALMASFTAFSEDSLPYVDGQGNISLPEHFRTHMSHIGSWFVPAGDASGLHDVFMQKQSLEHFRKTGEFQDLATIVKEVRAHKTGNFTTGNNVSYAQEVKLWFVMIRDTQNRFPDNKVWAEGWGWALINTDNPNKNTATSFEADCKGCHLPARETDWVFVEGYPVLRE